jgi:hypothetical protein
LVAFFIFRKSISFSEQSYVIYIKENEFLRIGVILTMLTYRSTLFFSADEKLCIITNNKDSTVQRA